MVLRKRPSLKCVKFFSTYENSRLGILLGASSGFSPFLMSFPKNSFFLCLKRYGAYTRLVYLSGYSSGGREMRRRHPRSISIGDDSSSWKLYTQSYSTGSFPWTCSDWFRPEWSAEENYQSISTGYINPSFGFILQNNSDFSITTFYNFDQ